LITGIAIYDTESINAPQALEIGMSFFDAIGVRVNAATELVMHSGDTMSERDRHLGMQHSAEKPGIMEAFLILLLFVYPHVTW